MPFTDDQINQLKEVMEFRLSKGHGTEWILTSISLKSLLARLEASEALNVKTREVIELLKQYEMPEFSMGKDWEEVYAAWLKSAGREGR